MTTTPIKIGDVVGDLLRDGMPLHFTAYDGSSAGPTDADIGLELVNLGRGQQLGARLHDCRCNAVVGRRSYHGSPGSVSAPICPTEAAGQRWPRARNLKRLKHPKTLYKYLVRDGF